MSPVLVAESVALNLQALNFVFSTVEQRHWQSWEAMGFLDKGIFINMVS